MALLIVVGALQDRPAPFAEQTFRHALDIRLGLLAACVKEDNLADAAAEQGFLFNIELGQRRKDVALDIVRRQRSVVEGLEEELDVQQKVGVGVQHSMLHIVAIQDAVDLREQLELVHGGVSSSARLVVCLAGLFHLHLEVDQQLVNFVFQILSSRVSPQVIITTRKGESDIQSRPCGGACLRHPASSSPHQALYQ